MSFGYSQTLPFDFEGTIHSFVGDGGVVVSNGTGNDVLQIVGGNIGDTTWDNAQVTFAAPIDLSDAENNTLRFTMQSITADPGEVHQHGVSFQGGGGSLEGNFQTIGQEVLNVELNFNEGLGSREKLVIFTDTADLGAIAVSNNQNGTPTGGLTGTYIIDNITLGADPETCSDNKMNQDETGVDCGGTFCAPCDVTAPTGFTAAAGTIGSFSVELLLNATDEASANITYDITGGATLQTTGASGVQKSLIINGLTPDTDYIFNVSASDASGNPASNNPIAVNAKTLVDSSNDCEGQTLDYAYTFETLPSGTDVRVTVTILNTVVGLVAQFFNDGNGNVNPIPVSGTPQKFEYTFPSLTNGAVIPFTAGFAWAAGGGLQVSRAYTVGDDCGTLGAKDFDLDSFSLFPNPTQDSWTLKTKIENIASINVFDILGKSVLSLSPNTSEATINGSNLKSGLYFAQVKTANGISTLKLVKK